MLHPSQLRYCSTQNTTPETASRRGSRIVVSGTGRRGRPCRSLLSWQEGHLWSENRLRRQIACPVVLKALNKVGVQQGSVFQSLGYGPLRMVDQVVHQLLCNRDQVRVKVLNKVADRECCGASVHNVITCAVYSPDLPIDVLVVLLQQLHDASRMTEHFSSEVP